MKEIIKNGYIISPQYDSSSRLSILIEDGMIKQIASEIEDNEASVIDACGNFIMPGLIDMHCNICDPGFEYVEDIETASMSAARGGYTTIACEPNTKPAVDNKTVVEYIISKSKIYSLVNILPYGSMSIDCMGKEMSEIGAMKQLGIVGISDGDNSISDSNLLRNVFKYSLMFDLPVMTHCEDVEISSTGVMNEGCTSTLLGLKGMPKEAEEIEVARNIVLAENVGSRLHLCHISTKGSVQLIREAKKRGVNVTCETCPHYFMLTEEAAIGYNTFAKVNPPLRTQEDVDAVIEGLVDGTIDVIASGHSPTKLEYKMKEFGNAAYGISAFETAFALSYTRLVDSKIISLSTLCEKMSENPAKILRLNKKGKIAPGEDADLTIVNTSEVWQVEPDEFLSKAKFTPFKGSYVKGRVLYTMVGGRLIF